LESLDLRFFVGDVIIRIGLGIFVQVTLGAKSQFFDSSFSWKLSYKCKSLEQ